jgi:hypothetical protein
MLDGPWPDGLPVPASVARGPTPRQLLAAAGAPLYPPDRLAEDTLRGLERNRPILIIPKRWYPVWLAWRIAPTAMTAYAARMTAASRHSLREDRVTPTPPGDPAPASTAPDLPPASIPADSARLVWGRRRRPR